MNTNDLLKIALESIYKHPQLQIALEKGPERNKKCLKIMRPLSHFYKSINDLATGTLILAIITYFWSILALISVGLFGMRLSPFFLIDLILITSLVFMSVLLIKVISFILLNLMEKQILKEFKISNTEKYQGDYIANGEKYFKTIPNNSYRGIPENKLNSVKLDRKGLDMNIQASGLITELISKQSNNKIFLQLELIN